MSKIRIRTIWLLAIAVQFPLVLSAKAAAPSGFEQKIKPFLKENCIRCHGEKKKKGKLALHKVSVDFSKAETSDLWVEILAQLTAADMPPPEEETQPTDSERNAVIEWIDRQLLTTGSGEAIAKSCYHQTTEIG